MPKNNLKQILDDRGLTQSELSEILGISPAAVSRLINGSRCGTVATWTKILKVLHLDWADMFPEFDEED